MKQFDTDNEELPMSEDYKPTYIKEQYNNNCQQFFGPITYSTFTMPAAQPSSSKKLKATKQKKKDIRPQKAKPMTLKYFQHGNNGVLMKQRERVDIVFKKWNEWGWLDDQTTADGFYDFFEGSSKHCNIIWTGNNTTVLTILLQELLKQDYIQEKTGLAAKSLVEQQFGKTPNSDKNRLDVESEDRIRLTLLILDTRNPLPERYGNNDREEYDIQDVALKEIFAGQLHQTKSTTL